jgi:hypothetical protein
MVELIKSFFRAKPILASRAARIEALAREIMPTLSLTDIGTATHEARIHEAFRLARIWDSECLAKVEAV